MIWSAIVVTELCLLLHRAHKYPGFEPRSVLHHGERTSSEGSRRRWGRRLAILAIGLFGALLLLYPGGRRLELRSRLGWLLLGYLAWCGLSILWSENLPLTIRHFSVLLFCSLGALGICAPVHLRDLCLVALVVSTILIANGVRTEIALGTFHPFSADYRFAGTLHPNVQAPYCATMALAAACLASRAKRGGALLWMLFLVGVALLVLTKSRTAAEHS